MNTRLSCTALCLIAGALCLFSGCATGAAGPGRYVVTSPKSPFYKYGPAQAFGADFALNRGQQVTVVEASFGFAKVTTDDGIAGYMPSDDLIPAPPDPLPQLRATPRTASRRIRGDNVRREPSTIEPGLPLFDGSDIPLPTNSEPPKKAKPGAHSDLPQP